MKFKLITHTFKHKIAFLKVEKELLGKNTLSGYLHDADKLFLYLLPLSKGVIQSIHRRYSNHHIEYKNLSKVNLVQAIIDWECARITKPDKPYNAYETALKYYPDCLIYIIPLLHELKLEYQIK